jgi:hypothetical protein
MRQERLPEGIPNGVAESIIVFIKIRSSFELG